MKYIATLVRGKSYTYQGKVFVNGAPLEVDAATAKYLDDNAKDSVTVEGRLEDRKKFKIEKVEAAKADEDAAPKARVRRRKPDEEIDAEAADVIEVEDV